MKKNARPDKAASKAVIKAMSKSPGKPRVAATLAPAAATTAAASLGNDDKLALIDQLSMSNRSLQKLEISLRFAGKTKAADDVHVRSAKLADEISTLLGKAMEDWQVDADKLAADLAAKQATIDAALADLKKQVDITKKIVGVLAAVDDIVAIAAKVL